MTELDTIDREKFALDSGYFDRYNKDHSATTYAEWKHAQAPFIARKRDLNRRRSSLYLNGALARMARQNIAVVVIGADHVPEMVDEYLRLDTRVSLYTARPNHCTLAPLTHDLP